MLTICAYGGDTYDTYDSKVCTPEEGGGGGGGI